jgi:hypothetical protein
MQKGRQTIRISNASTERFGKLAGIKDANENLEIYGDIAQQLAAVNEQYDAVCVLLAAMPCDTKLNELAARYEHEVGVLTTCHRILECKDDVPAHTVARAQWLMAQDRPFSNLVIPVEITDPEHPGYDRLQAQISTRFKEHMQVEIDRHKHTIIGDAIEQQKTIIP